MQIAISRSGREMIIQTLHCRDESCVTRLSVIVIDWLLSIWRWTKQPTDYLRLYNCYVKSVNHGYMHITDHHWTYSRPHLKSDGFLVMSSIIVEVISKLWRPEFADPLDSNAIRIIVIQLPKLTQKVTKFTGTLSNRWVINLKQFATWNSIDGEMISLKSLVNRFWKSRSPATEQSTIIQIRKS